MEKIKPEVATSVIAETQDGGSLSKKDRFSNFINECIEYHTSGYSQSKENPPMVDLRDLSDDFGYMINQLTGAKTAIDAIREKEEDINDPPHNEGCLKRMETDAALIAQAKNMYYVLKKAVEWIEDLGGKDNAGELFSDGHWHISGDLRIMSPDTIIADCEPHVYSALLRVKTEEEKKANARLFAQAKNMYYVLKLMSDKIQYGWQWNETEIAQWNTNAKAILQKVTGK